MKKNIVNQELLKTCKKAFHYLRDDSIDDLENKNSTGFFIILKQLNDVIAKAERK